MQCLAEFVVYVIWQLTKTILDVRKKTHLNIIEKSKYENGELYQNKTYDLIKHKKTDYC